MSAPLDKVYDNTGVSSGLDVNNSNGAVCEEMERGISLRIFFATCCNALISQALSMPFMFTTAGWFSFVIQALAASLTFICIQMLRATLRNEKVKRYAEERGVPAFEREYTFLGEFCAGNFGRGAITLVGSSFVILPDSHLIENLTAREPLFMNLVTAFSLATWTSTNMPSLPPYLGAIRGSLSVVYVYIIGLAGMQICDGVCKDFYPASLAGFPPAALPPWLVYCMYAFMLLRMFAILPIAMVPLMVACETVVGRILVGEILLENMVTPLLFSRAFIKPLLSSICVIGSIYFNQENVEVEQTEGLEARCQNLTTRAILVKEELAYSQAIASVLLTSCLLYICPLWFYAYVMRPAGIKLWAVYVSGVLVAAFVVVGTYTSIMGIISGSPGAFTERL
ncbi:hypothetical protein FOZ61_003668 [Perkinsus olseni]|uniref:Uncharacterized protein n=1 Tax=Perkinsus olseni TaxID=32597 RepID=A0A7J6LNP5_PEROL|nr:hypothetical protein FOZ61_003668 [Perkinsus olseni]